MSKRSKHKKSHSSEQQESQQIILPGTKPGDLWKQEFIYTGDLYSGQPYQRPIKDSIVDKLVREWDPPPAESVGGQLPGWPLLFGGWAAPPLCDAEEERRKRFAGALPYLSRLDLRAGG